MCFCFFALYITVPFSSQMTALLLEQLGIAEEWLPLTLTLGQSLEVSTLAVLPLVLLRLEEKGTLILGMLAWAVALTVLAVGASLWIVVASLGLHGLFICCFFVAGQMYVNRKAPPDVRASAQGMLQFINGLGMLIGHFLVGVLRGEMEDDFHAVFSVAAVVAGMLCVLFVVGFRTGAETPVGEGNPSETSPARA